MLIPPPPMITLLLVLCIETVYVLGDEVGACLPNCTCKQSEYDFSTFFVQCPYLDLSDVPEMLHPSSVQSLDLSNNRISSLKNFSFPNYTRLSDVILKFNEMEHIELNAFAGLMMMRSIDLSYNKLQSIHPAIFSSNPVLERVSLNRNPIVYLPSGSPILVSASVSFLDLSSCSLTAVYPNTFSCLPSLHILDLSSNNLQTMSMSTLEKLADLKKVELHNNRWTCSCEIVELMQLAREKTIQQPAHKPVKCLEGGQYRTLWTAAGSNRSCSESTTALPVVRKVTSGVRVDKPTTLTIRPPTTQYILPHRALTADKQMEVFGEDERVVVAESGKGLSDSLLSWNTNTLLVYIILPFSLGVAVFTSLITVNYFTKKMKTRMHHKIQGKDNNLAAFISRLPPLDTHLTADIRKPQQVYVRGDSQYSYCDKDHVYEEIY